MFIFLFGNFVKKIEYDLIPRNPYAFGVDLAFKNGASSGKLLGAGGGGFCLFLSKNFKEKKKLQKSLKKLSIVDYNFEKLGSQILYNK